MNVAAADGDCKDTQAGLEHFLQWTMIELLASQARMHVPYKIVLGLCEHMSCVFLEVKCMPIHTISRLQQPCLLAVAAQSNKWVLVFKWSCLIWEVYTLADAHFK